MKRGLSSKVITKYEEIIEDNNYLFYSKAICIITSTLESIYILKYWENNKNI